MLIGVPSVFATIGFYTRLNKVLGYIVVCLGKVPR